ncbi:MAG TPA: shikimate dehydrogenase [Verrucomicrobiales bacterium]|jgi:shikimate dehydrogenase|nr:shikimate dehydrogenase [Verrucomicrobiales bacterium]
MLHFLPALTGCFAQPVSENPTVAMMEAAFRHHGLHCRYINMDVSPADLADAVRGARAQGYIGFNCSLPHKVAVIAHLDGLAESARLIGAVNCAVKRDGLWIGENTDGKGFLESLQPLVSPAGQQVVLFGSGGAAHAIAVELALAGASRITLVNRSAERGAALASHLNSHTRCAAEFAAWDGNFRIPATAGIVVNATSIGLFPGVEERVAVAPETFLPQMIVADVIPNPPRTRFLKEAEAAGCRTLDGLGMLVNQGAKNIEYWLGVSPDKTVMRQALEEVFAAEK